MNTLDLVEAARTCVGVSRYRFRREECSGLAYVNCFTLPSELCLRFGVALPRDLRALLSVGAVLPHHGFELRPFDLVMTAGRWGEGYSCRTLGYCGVGHVSIATGDGMAVDASWEAGRVVEVSASYLLASDRYRGVLRIF